MWVSTCRIRMLAFCAYTWATYDHSILDEPAGSGSQPTCVHAMLNVIGLHSMSSLGKAKDFVSLRPRVCITLQIGSFPRSQRPKRHSYRREWSNNRFIAVLLHVKEPVWQWTLPTAHTAESINISTGIGLWLKVLFFEVPTHRSLLKDCTFTIKKESCCRTKETDVLSKRLEKHQAWIHLPSAGNIDEKKMECAGPVLSPLLSPRVKGEKNQGPVVYFRPPAEGFCLMQGATSAGWE